MTCAQEMCRNWTGDGCACAVFGIEPDVVTEADNDRISAMVEWLAEVIVDARQACADAESIEPMGSPEWVESGIAMRTTVLREVRKVLDRERNAHPSALDRVTRERDEALAEVVSVRLALGKQHKSERDALYAEVERLRDALRLNASCAEVEEDRQDAEIDTLRKRVALLREALKYPRSIVDENERLRETVERMQDGDACDSCMAEIADLTDVNAHLSAQVAAVRALCYDPDPDTDDGMTYILVAAIRAALDGEATP